MRKELLWLRRARIYRSVCESDLWCDCCSPRDSPPLFSQGAKEVLVLINFWYLIMCLNDRTPMFYPIYNFIWCFACWYFSKSTFWKIISGIPSEWQTVWIQFRPDVLSGLMWVQTVCKGYQQTTFSRQRVDLQHSMYFQSHQKQCRSWSDGLARSLLIWIYSVFRKKDKSKFSRTIVKNISSPIFQGKTWWGSAVVECLTQDRGAASSSLTCVTALCPWARTLILASTGSTQEDPSLYNWKIVDGT